MKKLFVVLCAISVIISLFVVGTPVMASCTYDWDYDGCCDIWLDNNTVTAKRTYGPYSTATSFAHIPGSNTFTCTYGTVNRNGVWGCPVTYSQSYSETHSNTFSYSGGLTVDLASRAKAQAGFTYTTTTQVSTSRSVGITDFLPQNKTGEFRWSQYYQYSGGVYRAEFWDMEYVWTSSGYHDFGSWYLEEYNPDAHVQFYAW